MRLCSVEGCEKKRVSNGFCQKHDRLDKLATVPGFAEKERERRRKWKKANPEKVASSNRKQEQRPEARARRKAYRVEHRETCRAATARWAAENREYLSGKRKEHYAVNREKVLEQNRAWRLAHLERFRRLVRKASHKRRSTELLIDTAGLEAAIDSGMRDLPCARCQRPAPSTIDHVLPLSWADVSEVAAALGEAWCYQPLCGPCNSAKRNFRVECYVPTGDIGCE